MKTKNAARITPAESEHMRRVKSVACVLCDAPPPCAAHHVEQGDHWTVIAVCESCHVGPKGIHGDQTMLRLRFKSGGARGELLAINATLARVYG